jgi:hypothetical protein
MMELSLSVIRDGGARDAASERAFAQLEIAPWLESERVGERVLRFTQRGESRARARTRYRLASRPYALLTREVPDY